MLPSHRVMLQGTTPHVHEQAAIEFVKKTLPDTDPFRIWALCDLVDVSGRRYEIDLLVLGYDAIYHVEIKSHPGRVSGDVVDWRFTFPDGGSIVRDNPLQLAERKSRVLGSLLDRRFGANRPFVETLIFLSDPDVKVELKDAARAKVITRGEFLRAVQFGEYPGAGARRRTPIDRPTAKKVVDAFAAIGLKKSEGAVRVGPYKLGALLSEGPGFQDYDAVHERMPEMQRRVRSYLVPHSPTAERREQLRRAAEREARVLTAIGDHPNILGLHGYEPEGPTGGACLLFEHFKNGERLDTFLRQNPALAVDERVQILEQVGDALGYCHRKQVLHRGVCPSAVLVRRRTDKKGLDTKLFNFQLAQGEGSQGTAHLSQLEGNAAVVYRAPELIADPEKATTASDVFSLGALAYFLFTGRHPGSTLSERHQLLTSGGGYLSLAAVEDSLAAGARVGAGADGLRDLEDVFQFGTDINPIERADDPIAWVQILLQQLTLPPAAAPAPTVPELDPLEARPGQDLGGFKVESVLGSGSTARVLRVSRDSRRYALKVSLSAELDERLRGEAETLKRLRGDRIVDCHETLVLGGRATLLLDDAGETLAEILAREGAQSLDYALRWGEDLLLALRELESRGVLHRDIKPANLGVPGAGSKRTRNLFLFDFSLSEADPNAIDIGTPAYRDPFIEERKRWDEAADRYSAALTLYEILTGTRPRWGDGSVPAIASTQSMSIEAERFDPSVREPLLGFFTKAFARNASERHLDAEAMRGDWFACFVAQRPVDKVEKEAPPPAPIDFAALRPETAVRAVEGLSIRAKNALDRAGVVSVQEAAALPANSLSALRGVGRETQKEIYHFTQGLRAASLAGSAEPPFFSELAGEDLPIGKLHGLSAAAIIELEGAGLTHAREVANTPQKRLARVLGRVPDGLGQVERALKSAKRIETVGEPRTLEDWVHRAFPRGNKSQEYVRELFGIDEAPGGGFAKDSTELAKRHRVAQPNISIALGKARAAWRADSALGPLVASVVTHLGALGGVATQRRLAELLLADLPHAGEEGAARAADALVRVAAEASAELKQGRVAERLWLARSAEHLALLGPLGSHADELCQREPLLSFEQAKDELARLVAETPLAGVAGERLVSLAAEASTRAALSARLELYPRGMSAERALRLSASALSAPRLRPERVAQLVALRYPEAAPLPTRDTDLVPLLAPHGLELRDGAFVRPAAIDPSTQFTQAVQRPRDPTTHGARRPTADPLEQAKREFQGRLESAKRSRSFRVLEVAAAEAANAEAKLSRVLDVRPISLEREILHALDDVIREREIADPSIVFDTDRKGPDGSEDWTTLTELMQDCAGRVTGRLVQETGTLLLTQPGILARYRLDAALHELLSATQRDDGPGIFLVVPGLSEPSPVPVIHAPHGALAIPLSSPAQRLPIPEVWLGKV
jgi:serine/threonine protein kinase